MGRFFSSKPSWPRAALLGLATLMMADTALAAYQLRYGKCDICPSCCAGGRTVAPIPQGGPQSTPPSTPRPAPRDPFFNIRAAELQRDAAGLAALISQPPPPSKATPANTGTLVVLHTECKWGIEGCLVNERIPLALVPRSSAGRGQQTASAGAWEQLKDAAGIAALAMKAPTTEDAAFLADEAAVALAGGEVRVALSRNGKSPFSATNQSLQRVRALATNLASARRYLEDISATRKNLLAEREKLVAPLTEKGDPPPCDVLGHCSVADDSAKGPQDHPWKQVAAVDMKLAEIVLLEERGKAAEEIAIEELEEAIEVAIEIVD